MQIGVNRWTMPAGLALRECFDMAARTGFDTIEVNIADDGELTASTTEQEARALLRAARDAGVSISSVSTGLGWKYPLTAPDTTTRQHGIQAVASQLRLGEWLEVDAALVVPGVVTEAVAYDDAYRLASEAMAQLAPIAAETGVHIAVENVWNKFLLSPLEFARFIDDIASAAVGAYFDVGNVLVTGYPEQWIRILGNRIRRIHVKDFRQNIGNITGFANPLQGDVPWDRVRAALDDIGYSGPVTAEVDGYRTREELGLRHIAESLRAVFGSSS